ncbi:MAG: cell wall-binding repeat-containing protein, partial [Desulfitobacterium hafniense]
MAKKKKSLALAVCLFVLLVALIPGTVWAADDDDVDWNKGVLAYLVVDAGSAQTVIGSADTIHFRLYDLNGDPYSGSVSGYITDPDDEVTYVSISGGQGNYSIANFNFDKLGSYSIFLWDQYDNYAGGTVKVVEPVITLTGKPVVHSESKVSVKIADPDGRVLARQSITVDGTEVGAGSSSYTTLFDGTFTFTITPKKTGTVSIIYGGHVVGTVEVMPAYTPGSRIGAQAADNMQLSVEV